MILLTPALALNMIFVKVACCFYSSKFHHFDIYSIINKEKINKEEIIKQMFVFYVD